MLRRNLKENSELEDMAPGQTESVTEQELLLNDGTDRDPVPIDHDAPGVTDDLPRKSPYAPASEPSTKQMRTLAVLEDPAAI